MGEKDKAEKALDQALEFWPEGGYPDILYLIARSYGQIGLAEKKEKTLEKMLTTPDQFWREVADHEMLVLKRTKKSAASWKGRPRRGEFICHTIPRLRTRPSSTRLSAANQAALSLSGFYRRLTQETAHLTARLELTDKALNESQAESERTKHFLSHLLDNLNTGVSCSTRRDAWSWPMKSRRACSTSRTASRDKRHSLARGFPGGSFRWRIGRSGLCGLAWPGRASPVVHPVPLPLARRKEGRSGLIALIEDVTGPGLIGAQRERTQTIQAMGEMAAEIAHQLRNPLGGIELFTSILGREVKAMNTWARWSTTFWPESSRSTTSSPTT